ncbi:MAG TPA: hypothetical protein P5086_04965 [Prolixibacteraceae bacterium]|nr:hypothetical protein [Prolixibacteraceae bacterium]HRV88646.1 hypothetical protein [Prolixibacteraceae bacterium]
MRNKKWIFLSLWVFLPGLFHSCQEETVTAEDPELLTRQEVQFEELMADLDAMVDEALFLQLNPLKAATGEGDYFRNSCPVVTYSRSDGTRVLTLNFGEGCTGRDGKVRSGKIIVTSGSFEESGFEREKRFDQFMVDGKKVEGRILKTITFDRQTLLRTASVEEEVTLTFPDDKGVVKRKASLTREYELHFPGIGRDNLMRSWGTVEVTRLNGIKFTKTITQENPVVFLVSCHRNVSGVVTFTTSDGRSWSLDYGDGTCDNLATLTKDGESKTIKLK